MSGNDATMQRDCRSERRYSLRKPAARRSQPTHENAQGVPRKRGKQRKGPAFAGPHQAFICQPVTSASALPISASERTVFTPASCSAANFSSAVPLPPEMIAPAWPIRLPAGP